MPKPETFVPPMGLLVKLGSIARHADEIFSDDGQDFDKQAFVSLLMDPEVAAWLHEMDKAALLPLKRKG